MDDYRSILTLLDISAKRGIPVVVLHVLSQGKELGKVFLADDQVVQCGDINRELLVQLKGYIKERFSEITSKRISQFLITHRDLAFQVTAELIEAPPCLYVFGAGHVGQAVAMMGAIIGYSVVVVDDRREFLTKDRFPNKRIDLFEGKYDNILSMLQISANSAIVIVTRGHQFDEVCLEQSLKTKARYIGMIGSRRRVLSIFARLEAAGISRELLGRVHAPIGLKIGAVSPQEIAVSIMAEIISVINGYAFDQSIERRKEE